MKNLIEKYIIFKKLVNFGILVKKYKIIKNLINFNKKIFINNNNQNNGLILIEYFNFYPSMIAFSIFSEILSKKYNSEIIAFNPKPVLIKRKIITFFYNLPISFWRIYKSFGAKRLVTPSNDKKKYSKKAKELITLIKSKQDLLDLKLENIYVGDLFYDEYLSSKSKSTLNLDDKDFKEFFLEAVSLFYYWHNFYSNNKVNAVILSHSVYLIGLCGRIAIFKNIPVYEVSAKFAYFLDKNNYIKYSRWLNYKNEFDKLNPETKKKLKDISKNQFQLRVSGLNDIKLNEDQITETKIYGKIDDSKKVLNQTGNKTKVLIAAHCFQDAVHAFGNDILFVDFHEWIDFLGKKSQKLLNFDWYLKLHPAVYSRNVRYAEYFIKKYPRINFLPKETTNSQLIHEGISVVLTCYGSVGHEYPAFGIPVVNAASDGPHKCYGFNIYPNNISEYSKYIDQLDKFKVENIDDVKGKIYEMYAMRYIMQYSPLENIIDVSQAQGHNFDDSVDVIKYWLRTIKIERINEIKKDYLNFINSKKYKMTPLSY